MNRQRRKSIQELINQMEELKSALESLQEEEQESYDNLPESFQEGGRGKQMQEAIDSLWSAVSSIEEAIDYATSAIEN